MSLPDAILHNLPLSGTTVLIFFKKFRSLREAPEVRAISGEVKEIISIETL